MGILNQRGKIGISCLPAGDMASAEKEKVEMQCATNSPFDTERLAAAQLFPRLDQPGHLVPAECAAVPDVVDPHRASLFRLSLWVDSRFSQPLLEHRVREAHIGADAAVEGIVGRCDVVVPPA